MSIKLNKYTIGNLHLFEIFSECNSMDDCDFEFHFSGAVSADPVPIPGRLSLSIRVDLSFSLPITVVLNKTITRNSADSDKYVVPCLDGVAGSVLFNC